MSATPESVWEYLQKIGEEIRELKELAKETDRRFKETDKRLEKRFKETDKRLEERFKETDKKIRELSNLFTTQWGKLVEALVEPGVIELFQKRGIKIEYLSRRVKKKDEKGRVIAEYDIILENKDELVVIEVKTTVKKEDVDEFLEKLEEFKVVNPKFRNYRVYGAIAGIDFEAGADRYAYKNGLFVLKSEGGIIRIANDEKFKPRVW